MLGLQERHRWILEMQGLLRKRIRMMMAIASERERLFTSPTLFDYKGQHVPQIRCTLCSDLIQS